MSGLRGSPRAILCVFCSDVPASRVKRMQPTASTRSRGGRVLWSLGFAHMSGLSPGVRGPGHHLVRTLARPKRKNVRTSSQPFGCAFPSHMSVCTPRVCCPRKVCALCVVVVGPRFMCTFQSPPPFPAPADALIRLRRSLAATSCPRSRHKGLLLAVDWAKPSRSSSAAQQRARVLVWAPWTRRYARALFLDHHPKTDPDAVSLCLRRLGLVKLAIRYGYVQR